MRFLFTLILAGLVAVGCADADQEDAASSADAVTAGKKAQGEFEGYFPSPSIVREGSTYHAYFAKQPIDSVIYNVAHATKTDADPHWKLQNDALPKLGKRALVRDNDVYAVWAPSVARVNAKQWVLYYTATLADGPTAEKKCIWRASATSADGPFTDASNGPMYCLEGSLWGIDPYVVEDENGGWWLAARIDEPGGINTIKIRKLTPNAMEFAPGSTWSKLTNNSPTSWEQPVLENAGVVRLTPPKGPARWFVFYSGAAWDDDSYAVGYADCGGSITGPCTKKTVDAPWLATNDAEGVYGPGTPTFYTNEAGEQLMSVQAWKHSGGKKNKKNNGQIMRTYKLTIDNAYRPKAELIRIDE